MKCQILYFAIKEGKDFKELEEHILNCPDCENCLEEYLNFKYLKFEEIPHLHNEFLEKFSENPFEEKFFKESLSCPLCFKILNTYIKTLKYLKKNPTKKGIKRTSRAPFKEEGIAEKFSSIALSLILFFVLTFATITKGNISYTFTKFQTFYAETKGKTRSFYGKILGYGAKKLKEEDKNEMHKSQ